MLTAHAGCLVNSSIIHLKRIKTKLYEAVLVTGLILVCIKGSLRKLLFVSVPHWKTYRLGWCLLWKDNSWAQILCPCESDSALLTDMTPQSENEPTELKQPALIRRRELGLLTLTVFHLPTLAAGLGWGAKMWFFLKEEINAQEVKQGNDLQSRLPVYTQVSSLDIRSDRRRLTKLRKWSKSGVGNSRTRVLVSCRF